MTIVKASALLERMGRRRGKMKGRRGPPPTYAEYFWTRVRKGAGCWIWTGTCVPAGYGQAWVPPRYWGAHRISWMLANGDIPRGFWVCHRCDNPPCVRPDHLFLGTRGDNVRDMMKKGRGPTQIQTHKAKIRGENNSQSKLTDVGVAEIRKRFATGSVRLGQLAEEFGVTRSVVGAAVRGHRWSHVPGAIAERLTVRGEGHPMSKLTSERVLEMRRDYANGESAALLARRNGVSTGTASEAIFGVKWAWLPGAVPSRRRAKRSRA